jgi:transposase
MFFPEGQIRVHLYGYPTDMRKSFDGLYALTREGLQRDPLLCAELQYASASHKHVAMLLIS